MESVFALLLFLFPLAYSPGPGNLFFASNGARFGFQRTLPANIGYHIATWLVTLLIGYGFFEIAQGLPFVFQWMTYIGSAYIFYLAYLFFRAGMRADNIEAKPASFWDGAILLVFNPKAYVIIATMFTQFLSSSSNTIDIIFITTLFTLNNLVAFSVWTYAGDRLLRHLRNHQNTKYLDRTLGMMLIIVALWILLR